MMPVQLELEDPYVVVYKQIHAVVDDEGRRVELIERSRCYGGSAWARYHYCSGPLVKGCRNIGECLKRFSRKLDHISLLRCGK